MTELPCIHGYATRTVRHGIEFVLVANTVDDLEQLFDQITSSSRLFRPEWCHPVAVVSTKTMEEQ